MYCPNCGEPIDDVKFCPECGYQISAPSINHLITIYRDASGGAQYVPIEIYVDGTYCGSVKRNSYASVYMADGDHIIALKLQGKSSSATFNPRQRECCHVSVEGLSCKPVFTDLASAPCATPGLKECNKWIAFLLCVFLGVLGFHKFYEGKVGAGILYLLTLGVCGVGVIIDAIILLCRPNPYYV